MQQQISRRYLLKSLGALALLTPVMNLRAAESSGVPLDVYKDPSCGCCGNWINHMTARGYTATIHHPADLTQVKLDLGVPVPMQSCHTAVTASGFVFEGHVPEKFIRQFLAAPPENALGLAVPGMPLGSPGMEVGGQFTPYDLMLLRKDGSSAVFARIESASQQG